MHDNLALAGGEPVARNLLWPEWPNFDARTEARLAETLRSRRWAVSWASTGEPSRERQFAAAFAAYNEIAHCVSVDHGSSALVVALEALGIGPGDEVIVPAMTWVAPITAVLRVGALPVIADVDPRSGCLTPDTIEEAMGPAVRAIVVVHLACTVADIVAIRELAGRRGIGLVEDCAQAHGASIDQKKVGTFGDLGAFSFQAGKVLTGGEGGAVITADDHLQMRLEELRADSRRYISRPARRGEEELEISGSIMGANYCMSEWSATVLLDRLDHLDAEHQVREKNAQLVEDGLSAMPGLRTLSAPPGSVTRSIYEFAIQIDEPSPLSRTDTAKVADALSGELGISCWQADIPLPRSPYFHPESKTRFARTWNDDADSRARGRSYPGAEAYHSSTILWHHRALLGTREHAEAILAALAKVERHAATLQ